jgi:hypothetical protein
MCLIKIIIIKIITLINIFKAKINLIYIKFNMNIFFINYYSKKYFQKSFLIFIFIFFYSLKKNGLK